MEKKDKPQSKRSALRQRYAEDVCREVLWQLTHYGVVSEVARVRNLVSKWYRISTKPYDRPK